MEHFDRIYERAVARKGADQLAAQLPSPRSALGLKRLPAERYLSEMSRAVFRAGFVWKIVDYKWQGMTEVLHGFDPVACAFQPDEALEALLQDERAIRHLVKLRSIRDNAAFILEVEKSHGSFGQYVAAWPVTDIVGLHADLKKRGSRLGGRTGQFFLRRVGKDTFCLTRDVVGALARQGIVDRQPTSRRDLRQVQAAFNEWQQQSGRPLCEISRILSCSIDG